MLTTQAGSRSFCFSSLPLIALIEPQCGLITTTVEPNLFTFDPLTDLRVHRRTSEFCLLNEMLQRGSLSDTYTRDFTMFVDESEQWRKKQH